MCIALWVQVSDGKLESSWLASLDAETFVLLLFFRPNGLQHKLSPFKLVDPTKKGHRRFFVFFLVSWEQRRFVVSSFQGSNKKADLPPSLDWPNQQSSLDHWDSTSTKFLDSQWSQRDEKETRLSKLPAEVREDIFEWTDRVSRIKSETHDQASNSEVKASISVPYISHEETLEIRLELMEERSAHQKRVDYKFQDTWSLCEHWMQSCYIYYLYFEWNWRQLWCESDQILASLL